MSTGNGLSPPFCAPALIQRGFWLEAKQPALHTCGTEDWGGGQGRCTGDGETGGMIEKGREEETFFSLRSSIGSAACCLVTAAPFEKPSVSLEISLKIHPQSAYQTFLLTVGQQHAM